MHDEQVRSRHDLIERRIARAERLFIRFRKAAALEIDDVHLERSSIAGEFAADLAEADDAKGQPEKGFQSGNAGEFE